MLPMVLAGQGQAVLPCFIGDPEERLERVGGVIDELTHDQWLVAHHADRHLESVRIVIDRLAELIQGDVERFAGEATYGSRDTG